MTEITGRLPRTRRKGVTSLRRLRVCALSAVLASAATWLQCTEERKVHDSAHSRLTGLTGGGLTGRGFGSLPVGASAAAMGISAF